MKLASKVACVIPVFNGEPEIKRLLSSFDNQSLSFDLFMVDSESKDGSRRIIENYLCGDCDYVKNSEFNHGKTRQMMVDRHNGYDIYIFMTQDAYLEDGHALSRLVAAFNDSNVGTAFGRQLPHHDATPVSQHARLFNYPATSRTVAYEDRTRLGFKAAFSSNSFAAYRATALSEVGGFPSHTIVSEDMYVAAKMLMKGWKVAYASDALCRHSHDYTLCQEFRRYFDIGVFNAREAWIRERFGAPDGEGKRYVLSEIRFILPGGWYMLPEVALRNFCKYLGFTLGLQERFLPLWIKRRFSMNKKFWS